MSDFLACLVSSIPAAHKAVQTLSQYVSSIDERLLSWDMARTEINTATDLNGRGPNNLSNISNAFEHILWSENMSLGLDHQ